ncbi:MAG TPA: hypothetical protein VGH39_04055 [Xanthobacteraceae bacterium]|jgi:hypothetical protein
MDEEKQPTSESGPESPADRRLANIVLLVLLAVLIGGGVWLANAMYEQRMLDDCLAQGRRNCAPVDGPSR